MAFITTKDGTDIFYKDWGQGQPIVFHHGWPLSADDWDAQMMFFLGHGYRVIAHDRRGHGRSTRDQRPYGYDIMADDVVGLMDFLKIKKAAIVGWSDGAILGIDLALRHPARVTKVFAFAANTDPSGVVDGVEKNPTFAKFIERAGDEYRKLSATPKDYDAFVEAISKMWATEPNWTPAQLATIKTPILILSGLGATEDKVKGLVSGADDYITKPFINEDILQTVRNALRQTELFRENRYLRRELKQQYNFDNIIGRSEALAEVFRLVEKPGRTVHARTLHKVRLWLAKQKRGRKAA